MKQIRLYDTLTGEKKDFKPLKAGEVSIYNCGPTVYNYAHIGNFRTYIFGDVLRRVFEYNGYKVRQVMNITDVDDKTIRDSKKNGMSLKEFTRKYEEIFMNELAELHIKIPTAMPRATESIDQMISLIQILIDKGFAYRTSDGVYFSIKKSNGYGKLAGLDVADLCSNHDHGEYTEAGHRIKNDEYEKENAQDFALWKFYNEQDGNVFWEAPFGKGRPGWHIECSAMAMNALGPTIDIHTGARDLIFPHHTNEIAQSEGVTGKTFANTWMHAGFLNVDSQKMAKSAGNFYTLPVLKEKGISPITYRYWLLTAHYRTPLNFTDEYVKSAGIALQKLETAVGQLWSEVSGDDFSKNPVDRVNETYKEEFLSAINDDLNVSKGLALAWELLKDKSVDAKTKLATLLDFDNIFGLGLMDTAKKLAENSTNENMTAEMLNLPDKVQAAIEKRKAAREAKDWGTADKLRDEIFALGYEVKDTADGQIVKKI